jgi:hypothetical protein
LVTRGPGNLGDAEKRGLLYASNVRCEDGVLRNAPGYRLLPTSEPLDSPVNLLFQANLASDFEAIEGRSPIVGTGGKLWALSRVEALPPPRLPLVVNAGPDASQWFGRGLELSGSSHDPNPNPKTLTVWWEKVSGPGALNISSIWDMSATVSVTAAGLYVLKLSASDGVVTVSDTVTLNFYANVAPVVDAGPDQYDLPQGGTDLNGSAVDPDDGPEPLTVTWQQISGPAPLTIDGIHDLRPHVQPTRIGEYVLRLTASDGIDTVSDDVTLVCRMRLGDFDSAVHDAAVDGMGRIVLVGNFTKYTKDGVDYPCYHICRLNEFGNLDVNFSNNCKLTYRGDGSAAVEPFFQVLIQPDNKILVMPGHTLYSDSLVSHDERIKVRWNGSPFESLVVRLNQDGTLDDSFQEKYSNFFEIPRPYSFYQTFIHKMDLAPDGRVILSAKESKLDEQGSFIIGSFSRVVKLTASGGVDSVFETQNTSGDLYNAVVLGFDGSGRCLVNAPFRSYYVDKTLVAKTLSAGVLRLNPDFSLDQDYQAGQYNGTYPTTNNHCWTLLDDGTVIHIFNDNNTTLKARLVDTAGFLVDLFSAGVDAFGSSKLGTLLDDGYVYFQSVTGGTRLRRFNSASLDWESVSHVALGERKHLDARTLIGLIRYGDGYLLFGDLNVKLYSGSATVTRQIALVNANWELQA